MREIPTLRQKLFGIRQITPREAWQFFETSRRFARVTMSCVCKYHFLDKGTFIMAWHVGYPRQFYVVPKNALLLLLAWKLRSGSR